MKFAQTRNREQIERFLRRDTSTHIYALADLDPFFWPGTTWYAAVEGGQVCAICLVLDKLSIPIVYSIDAPQHAPSTELMQHIRERLPDRFFANLSEHLVAPFEENHTLEGVETFQKMVLVKFHAPPAIDARIDRLGADDLGELQNFYSKNAYATGETDQRFLEAYMLTMGPYFGIREGGSLICAGGIHLVSERYRVAALGNIATRPDRRNRGFGRAVSAAICRDLTNRVDSIGLNVMASNASAIRCYQNLGFEPCATYLEGIIARKATPIVSSV